MANRATISAGLLLYRCSGDALEVLLAHPGGPFWAKKDLGAWSIPKGEYAEGDRFIGVTVPQIRAICRGCRGTSLAESGRLLQSPVHEDRLAAILLLVDAFTRAGCFATPVSPGPEK